MLRAGRPSPEGWGPSPGGYPILAGSGRFATLAVDTGWGPTPAGGFVRPSLAGDTGHSSLHTGLLAGSIRGQYSRFPNHRRSGGIGSSLVGTGRSDNRFAADTADCRNRQDSSRIAA